VEGEPPASRTPVFLLRYPVLFLAALLCAGVRAEDKPIQCANLIYGGRHTSRCFSDEFLTAAQKLTTVATERRFRSVKLDSEELFSYPFVLITGEEDFMLSQKEREHLKKYCENGGFLLASAGCSSSPFDRAFRREIESVFGKDELKELPMDHAILRTVTEIKEFNLKHQDAGAKLWGLERNGKVVIVYSPHGLNDTQNAEGCCCCGGNEIRNALEINVNILVYALCH
jgi:hypothetical protein